MRQLIQGFAYVALVAVAMSGCTSPEHYPSEPLSEEEALERFQISEGFRIEVFATEPEIVDPVDLAFDAQGRVFAVEMRDFPYETAPGEGNSRIRLLEDVNGDGRVDRSTVFADSLTEATSIMPWKGGLLVTAAPDILYLKDTDGDKKADVRRKLFTGFFTENLEAQVTNLRFAIDNWVYASNAGNPGDITFAEQPDAPPVSIDGRDFRFRLDREQFEPASGSAQFGQDFDEWGHRFITQNTIHVRHVVLPHQYVSRNGLLPSKATTQNISQHSLRMFQLTEPPYWRVVRTERRNERYDEAGLDRTEHASGYFTGATGGTVYSGHTFPNAYHGNLFTADIAGNLIHRDLLSSKGATFVAERPEEEQEREFLSSTDPWFRPTNLKVGPDGSLYIMDMYRLHVESPISIPDDLEEEMDYSRGERSGRIYRIVPESNTTAFELADLSQAETSKLVQLLAHANRWQRLTAQRLLLERQDRSAVPLLEHMVGESESPQARLHALYALEGLSALNASILEEAIEDAYPGVREHAVRLAEQFPELLPQIARRVEDASARVVFQAALSLGEFTSERALNALAYVAAHYAQDAWFQRAILSSRAGSSARLLEALVDDHRFFQAPDTKKEEFLKALARVIGARGEEEEVMQLLELLSKSDALQNEEWQVASLAGLAEGLEEVETSRIEEGIVEDTMRQLLSSSSDTIRVVAGKVAEHFEGEWEAVE